MRNKYNHNGLPKRRVIVAAEQELQKRTRAAELRGIRRGKRMGASILARSFNSLSFFKRIGIAIRGLDFASRG